MGNYVSITPDALVALGSYVAHEWGDYGYRFEGFATYGPVTVGKVVASDGSRFVVMADRYGNRDHYVPAMGDPKLADYVDKVTELGRKASA